MTEKRDRSGTEIPDYVIDALARCLLPKIQKYYESEEGQQTFKNWKEAQKTEKLR